MYTYGQDDSLNVGNLSIDFHQFMKKYHRRYIDSQISIYQPAIGFLTIVLSILSVVGTLGNILVIKFFSPYMNRSASHLFVTFLGFIDLMLCSIDIPCTIYTRIWEHESMDGLCKLHVTIKAFMLHLSASLLVLIAVDRYLIVCFVPSIRMGTRSALVAFFISAVGSMLLALPMGLHNGVLLHAMNSQEDFIVLKNIHKDTSVTSPNTSVAAPPLINHTAVSRQYTVMEKLTQVGQCETDLRYIGEHSYKAFRHFLFAVFILMFLIILVFYTLIFFYIKKRSRLWVTKCNKSVPFVCSRLFPNVTTPFETNSEADRIIEEMLDEDDASLNRISMVDLTLANHKDNNLNNNNYISDNNSGEHSINDDNMEVAQNELLIKRDSTHKITPDAINKTPMPDKACSNDRINHVNTDDTNITNTVTRGEGNNIDKVNIKSKKSTATTKEPLIAKSIRKATNTGISVANATPINDSIVKIVRRPLHVRTAQTLVLVSLAFLISYTPHYLIVNEIIFPDRYTDLIKRSKDTQWDWNHTIRKIIFYIYYLNSTVNPVIYSCMNQEFRKDLKSSFDRCRRRILTLSGEPSSAQNNSNTR